MIASIDSPGDPRLEPYRRVGDHEWLRTRGLFVAEGRLVVRRLIDARRFRIASVLVTPAARAALGPSLDRPAFDVWVADRSTLETITGFNFHRGCLALAERPQPSSCRDLERGTLLLALEGIGNPDNVGGLFRVALALGGAGILIGPGTGDPFYRKAVRTSMAAVLQVPWAHADEWPAALEALRSAGFRLAALTPHPSAMPLDTFAARRHPRIVLLLGAEGSGLSETTLARSDDRVRIPVAPEVDSLNVTVAAGIALYAVRAHARPQALEP